MITLPAKKDARYQCSFLLFSFYCIPDMYSLSFEFIVAIQTQKGNKIRIQKPKALSYRFVMVAVES